MREQEKPLRVVEKFSVRKILSAIVAGAIIGMMLYESGVANTFIEKVSAFDRQQRIELCGENLDHCPASEEPLRLPPGGLW